MTEKEKEKRIMVNLTEDTHHRLKMEAAKQKRTAKSIVVESVEAFLKKAAFLKNGEKSKE